jgi:hypothetical protein
VTLTQNPIIACKSSLRRAPAEEISDAISFALRYDSRKRVHDEAEALARITADRLVRHLQQSGRAHHRDHATVDRLSLP